MSVSSFNWQQGHAEYALADDASALAADSRPAVLMTMREGKPGGGKGPLLVEEESLTLATGNGQTLFQPQAFQQNQREEVRLMGDQAGALAANPGVHQQNYLAIPQAFDEMNFTTSDQHHVLRAGTKQSTGVVEPWGFSAGNSEHARSMGETQGISPPIRSAASGTNQTPTVGPTQYGVRRLTPVECERLQAFPDGWTEPAGSDSARYKALGNAVTVNTVWWILRRMKAQG